MKKKLHFIGQNVKKTSSLELLTVVKDSDRETKLNVSKKVNLIVIHFFHCSIKRDTSQTYISPFMS